MTAWVFGHAKVARVKGQPVGLDVLAVAAVLALEPPVVDGLREGLQGRPARGLDPHAFVILQKN